MKIENIKPTPEQIEFALSLRGKSEQEIIMACEHKMLTDCNFFNNVKEKPKGRAKWVGFFKDVSQSCVDDLYSVANMESQDDFENRIRANKNITDNIVRKLMGRIKTAMA